MTLCRDRGVFPWSFPFRWQSVNVWRPQAGPKVWSLFGSKHPGLKSPFMTTFLRIGFVGKIKVKGEHLPQMFCLLQKCLSKPPNWTRTDRTHPQSPFLVARQPHKMDAENTECSPSVHLGRFIYNSFLRMQKGSQSPHRQWEQKWQQNDCGF